LAGVARLRNCPLSGVKENTILETICTFPARVELRSRSKGKRYIIVTFVGHLHPDIVSNIAAIVYNGIYISLLLSGNSGKVSMFIDVDEMSAPHPAFGG
jgi:hypothetical protein